jgi:hypothetical protein
MENLSAQLANQTTLLLQQLQRSQLYPGAQIPSPQKTDSSSDPIDVDFEPLFAENLPEEDFPNPNPRITSRRKRSFFRQKWLGFTSILASVIIIIGLWVVQPDLSSFLNQRLTSVREVEDQPATISPEIEEPRSPEPERLEPKTEENRTIKDDPNLEQPLTNVPQNLEASRPKLPPLPLTPEQRLRDQVASQLNNLNQQLTRQVVIDLNVNVRISLLKIIVNDDWYDLAARDQQKLVNQAYDEGTFLHFQKIQFWDQKNHLLARNSVIGQEMLILKSSL